MENMLFGERNLFIFRFKVKFDVNSFEFFNFCLKKVLMLLGEDTISVHITCAQLSCEIYAHRTDLGRLSNSPYILKLPPVSTFDNVTRLSGVRRSTELILNI